MSIDLKQHVTDHILNFRMREFLPEGITDFEVINVEFVTQPTLEEFSVGFSSGPPDSTPVGTQRKTALNNGTTELGVGGEFSVTHTEESSLSVNTYIEGTYTSSLTVGFEAPAGPKAESSISYSTTLGGGVEHVDVAGSEYESTHTYNATLPPNSRQEFTMTTYDTELTLPWSSKLNLKNCMIKYTIRPKPKLCVKLYIHQHFGGYRGTVDANDGDRPGLRWDTNHGGYLACDDTSNVNGEDLHDDIGSFSVFGRGLFRVYSGKNYTGLYRDYYCRDGERRNRS